MWLATGVVDTRRDGANDVLLTLRQPSVALFVPVSFTALMGSTVVASVHGIVVAPSVGVGLSAVVSVAIFGFVLSMYRLVWISGDRIVAQGVFGREVVDVSRAAIGVRRESGRSPNYEVYATDGDRRAVLATTFTETGADWAARRLARALGLDDDTGGHASTRGAARKIVSDVREGQRQADAAAKAFAAENARKYRTSSIVVVMIALVMVTVYVGVMMYLQAHH